MQDQAEAITEAGSNRRVALLIAAMALALALTEVAGDDAKTEAQIRNVEGANLWAFFQAKTVRQTMLRGMSEMLPLLDAKDGREAEAGGCSNAGKPPSSGGRPSPRRTRGGVN